jgi:hypothetical protein
VPSAAAWTAIGVAEGDGEMPGDAPKVDGTDTMPASFGDIVSEGVGLGLGVAVETSTADDGGVDAGGGGVIGVPVGVGVEVGVSVGVGGWANNSAVARNAARPKAARKNCFAITNWERGELDERRLKRGFNQC